MALIAIRTCIHPRCSKKCVRFVCLMIKKWNEGYPCSSACCVVVMPTASTQIPVYISHPVQLLTRPSAFPAGRTDPRASNIEVHPDGVRARPRQWWHRKQTRLGAAEWERGMKVSTVGVAAHVR